mmetsp:Transcript_4610/g.8201  ORF Transcript_4610/g.8201 Transcript_4610/m.8201 type:complete len:92 (-) Transcript_4610:132-407(-)
MVPRKLAYLEMAYSNAHTNTPSIISMVADNKASNLAALALANLDLDGRKHGLEHWLQIDESGQVVESARKARIHRTSGIHDKIDVPFRVVE